MNLDAELDRFISGFPEEKQERILGLFCDAFDEVISEYSHLPARTALLWFDEHVSRYNEMYGANPASRLLDAFVQNYLHVKSLS
jgi:hypothetical protein